MAKKVVTVEDITAIVLSIFATIRGQVPGATIDDAIAIYKLSQSGSDANP